MPRTDFIQFRSGPGCLSLHDAGIVIAQDEPQGVKLAIGALAADICRVMGKTTVGIHEIASQQESAAVSLPETAIIIGSLQSSPVIERLSRSGAIGTQQIRDSAESFVTALVEHPLAGVRRALVIAGSDKRGTIYGAYTLAEQIGVSPYVQHCSRCNHGI